MPFDPDKGGTDTEHGPDWKDAAERKALKDEAERIVGRPELVHPSGGRFRGDDVPDPDDLRDHGGHP